MKGGLIKMQKGYWISLYFKIDNSENLNKYAETVTPIIKSFGGVPLVRGGKYETFDGDNFIRTVVWEFPTYEKAIQCHESKEYQAGWSIAKETTLRHMQIVEGFNIE
tara:strand:+ start:199 stop:519 length:321 start_codon:yes stop_codon:yes gene_type:complete